MRDEQHTSSVGHKHNWDHKVKDKYIPNRLGANAEDEIYCTGNMYSGASLDKHLRTEDQKQKQCIPKPRLPDLRKRDDEFRENIHLRADAEHGIHFWDHRTPRGLWASSKNGIHHHEDIANHFSGGGPCTY